MRSSTDVAPSGPSNTGVIASILETFASFSVLGRDIKLDATAVSSGSDADGDERPRKSKSVASVVSG
jgi:hypothetical protein